MTPEEMKEKCEANPERCWEKIKEMCKDDQKCLDDMKALRDKLNDEAAF